ncbi:hypothetical protein AX774_g6155 [Zancudomyces culisetae]|uniref:Uncharacterized protein n=1 Tax=Zancudomyces culisetae TaxID=1213189 RepID=A0A1R1PHF5_ZANCU|nr:hypothetical protein AX774_g6155 [Zancudomyces culisetae]|eukprot:OMH80406.1 hypothetical protein AX774_g6155 [Zancudomyces culisetae]
MSMQRSSLTGSLKERVGRRGNSHVEDNAQDVEVVYTSVEQIDEILKNDSRNSKAALLKKKLKKRTLIPTLVIPQDEAEAI